MDFWLGERLELMAVAQALKAALPPGMDISDVSEVDLHTPALETQLKSAEYRVTFKEPVDRVELEKKVAELLKADSLPRERRGKAYDLRPLVEGLRVEAGWEAVDEAGGAPGRDRKAGGSAISPGSKSGGYFSRQDESVDPNKTPQMERFHFN